MLEPVSEPRRCAIYTRKSVASPYDEEVTSLQAQRAICSAYIASQSHRNWVELSKAYDDEGQSGAMLDRPSLRALVDDIEQGLIDVVLVYKLDRITRSLMDFLRVVDFFDRHGVAFISITQNFDTGDSIGKLIRNILLTFAEFERQIASDRIRDKARITTQRGHWWGGAAPIGYDLKRSKLVINKDEAKAVCRAFELFVEKKRYGQVADALRLEGHQRKVWRSRRGGIVYGGTPISTSSVRYILFNRVYIGELTFNGERSQGRHQAIVDRALWDSVQDIISERATPRTPYATHSLAGLLVDPHGRRMHGNRTRSGIRYAAVHRYYQTTIAALTDSKSLRFLRVNADRIERIVHSALQEMFHDRIKLREILLIAGAHSEQLDRLCADGPTSAQRLASLSLEKTLEAHKLLIAKIEVGFDRVWIFIRLKALVAFLRWEGVGLFEVGTLELYRSSRVHRIEIPVELFGRGSSHWLLSVRPAQEGRKDQSLLALLARARQAQQSVFDNGGRSLSELAAAMNLAQTHFLKLVQLNYLAPDIVAAIMNGHQPSGLTRSEILKHDLALDWAHQRRQLGFPAVSYGAPRPGEEPNSG